MKKTILLSVAVLLSAALGFSSSALAQKKHAPKPVWGAMVGGLSDIQAITAAMMVFDMKRAAKIAGELQGRETYISKIERLPAAVREGHGKVAEAAGKLVAAAKAGEEQEIAKALSGVMQACNDCHYNKRDAKRRKDMK
jgi:hypothetical protein